MADTPANHVWYDGEGKERPASEKPSMDGQPPADFREEGRPAPMDAKTWADLNDRHLKLERAGKGGLVERNLQAGMALNDAIEAAEKAKSDKPKADAPAGGEG